MPRAGLTEDRVVAEAELMADEAGLPTVTLAALAARLGVRQPSLYKHIESLASLHRSISIRAKREIADVLARAAVGRSRREAIHSIAYAHAYRTWALAHPGRYAAMQHSPARGDEEDEAVSVALVELFADCLAGYDWLPADIDHSFERMVGGLVLIRAGQGPGARSRRGATMTPRSDHDTAPDGARQAGPGAVLGNLVHATPLPAVLMIPGGGSTGRSSGPGALSGGPASAPAASWATA